MLEQTRFRSTVFLYREFKLENIYSGINFYGKSMCDNSYLRELILRIAGKTAKIAKVRTRKNFSPHGTSKEEECLLLKIPKNLLHVFSKLGYA